MKRIARFVFVTALFLLNRAGVLARQSDAVPLNQLSIVEAHANPNNTVTITGLNFGTAIPKVNLGQIALSVLNSSDTRLVAQLPPDIEPGTYLLTVLTGWGSTEFDTFTLTIGTLGNGPERTHEPIHAANAVELRMQGLKEYRLGHYVEALRLLENALSLASTGNDTYVLALIHEGIGDVYQNQFEFPKAEQAYIRAAEILRNQPEHAQALAMTLRNLGGALAGQRRLSEAMAAFTEASNVIRNHAVEDFQLELQILNGMGAVYFQRGQTRKAKATFDRALKMKTKPQSGLTLDFADVWNNLATIYVDERNYEKAADSYMRALELTERRLGASHPNLTMILNNLGLMYIAMRRYEEAERYFRRSLDILERNGLMSNYLAFRTLYGLGRTYVEKNDRNQAEALLARAVQIGRSTGQHTTEMIEALELYSNLLRSLSRQSEAESLHFEAARIRGELVWTTRAGFGK